MMWINLIAVIVAPIVAVIIGQKLQDRAEKRKDKMAVFKALMTYRYGWSQESAIALNSSNLHLSDNNLQLSGKALPAG